MREVLFIVNDFDTLVPQQTTAQLMMAAAAQGLRVWVAPVKGLGRSPAGADVVARELGSAASTVVKLLDVDAIWVRINPGRARRPVSGLLELLAAVEEEGMPVLNAPSGLQRAASKVFLGSLPAWTVPRTWMSEDPERLATWLSRELAGPGVVKPATGTRGEQVVRVVPGMEGLEDALLAATAAGPALLQEYLVEAPEGDLRVHVVGGELLEVHGRAAVVRRVPAAGEWRSNVALGGRPVEAQVDGGLRKLVADVGPTLERLGLWHVGLDVVGDRIVECNVFSPGGLGDAEAFTGRRFCEELVSRAVERFDRGLGTSPA